MFTVEEVSPPVSRMPFVGVETRKEVHAEC